MAIIVGNLAGKNKTKDYQLQTIASSIINAGIISGLGIAGDGTLSAGSAIIDITRTGGVSFKIPVFITENISLTLEANKKIFIKIPQNNIDDGDTYNTNTDGTGIAVIEQADSYPSANYIALAETNGSSEPTDVRQNVTIKKEVSNRLVYGASSTGNDDYEISITGIESLQTGYYFEFMADVTNTGAATLNINSIGAKTIKKANDTDLGDGDIEANQIVGVIYNGVDDVFEMVSQIATLPTVDVEGLAEEVSPDDDSFALVSKGGTLNKSRVDNIVNSLKKYQLNGTLGFNEFVRLLDTGKVDKLDIKSMTTITAQASFSDGRPFDVFKLDDNHFGVYIGNNGSDAYPRVGIYTFDNDGNAVETQTYNTLTTSHTTSSSYTSFYSVPMGNNYFVFLMSDNNGYIQAVISQFNPDTGTLTNGTRYTIDSTSSNRGPMSGARMTDNTLLIMYYGNIVRKATINTASKTFTTLGSSFTIPSAYTSTSSMQPQPITSWGADVGAVCYIKYISQLKVYTSKITCTGHDIAFSEEVLVNEEGSYHSYIRYGTSDHTAFGGTGRKMMWIGTGGYSGEHGRAQLINYDDVAGFQIGTKIDFGYRNTADYGVIDGDKALVFIYDYDGTGNGRYYNLMSIDGVTLTQDEELNTSTGTYVLYGCRIAGNIVYGQNNQSSNSLYIFGKVKNMTNFFGILKEAGVLDDFKKVARYGNVSNGHSDLTPGKEFGYGRAISNEEILLYKNT